MKALLILLILIGCNRNQVPSFHYSSEVEITSGFYKNHQGVVLDYRCDIDYCLYKVRIYNKLVQNIDDIWIKDTDLKNL